ncbi:unconventional myosin-XVIIIb [Pontoporia blainvillei]|uniref:Unconventional myosin-XVIIIb n=1 Tax=Pontoporia blainvillei TaxID=48723 RepID=A0ABX0S1M1_PONBL|nr:unconventional myosin-XVIIIb [Pontoporia blainvillei]
MLVTRCCRLRFHETLKLQQSEARCEDALKTQKALTADLESMHSELESMTRSKSLVDQQLYRLQFERADLLKHIEEDQDDLNDLMQKHKDLIAQSAADIGQIQELQLQLEEAKKEKQKLQEQLQVAQMRIEYLEQSTVDRAIVSRQEAVICDLENKTGFQKVQIKRFEVLVVRLRDSLMKMGEELSQAATAESQQRESSQYYQRRLEELKVDMEELVQREAEASRRAFSETTQNVLLFGPEGFKSQSSSPPCPVHSGFVTGLTTLSSCSKYVSRATASGGQCHPHSSAPDKPAALLSCRDEVKLRRDPGSQTDPSPVTGSASTRLGPGRGKGSFFQLPG